MIIQVVVRRGNRTEWKLQAVGAKAGVAGIQIVAGARAANADRCQQAAGGAYVLVGVNVEVRGGDRTRRAAGDAESPRNASGGLKHARRWIRNGCGVGLKLKGDRSVGERRAVQGPGRVRDCKGVDDGACRRLQGKANDEYGRPKNALTRRWLLSYRPAAGEVMAAGQQPLYSQTNKQGPFISFCRARGGGPTSPPACPCSARPATSARARSNRGSPWRPSRAGR